MDTAVLKGLNDKLYDRRKAAALEVEKIIRDALAHGDTSKVKSIISQLVELASNTSSHHSNIRNGGIMGLAGASIALGQQHIAPYLGDIAPPILACFHDPDQRVRYFACESMYNVAKVAKGEVLIYFNELFDAMSKLAADVDQAVKNGGELLDRLIKDIVTEQASTYVSARPTTPDPVDDTDVEPQKPRLTEKSLRAHTLAAQYPGGADRETRRAFSLARFVPLLAERIYVINPFTRTYLVSWLTVLDSIPEVELVTYLPHFLDGLLKFLGDPTEDIRNATMHVLADFLKEIREAAEVARVRAEAKATRREKRAQQKEENSRKKRSQSRSTRGQSIEPSDLSMTTPSETESVKLSSRRHSADKLAQTAAPSSPTSREKERDTGGLGGITEEDDLDVSQEREEQDAQHLDGHDEDSEESDEELDEDAEGEGTGRWVPGQGVRIEHAAIVEILLQHLSFPDEEIQATCLRWIAEFLLFVKDTMVTFTPRLVPVILSSLAHHVPAIRQAALQTNYNLFRVVQQLPVPPQARPQQEAPHPSASQQPHPSQPSHGRRDSASNLRVNTSTKMDSVPFPTSSPALGMSSMPTATPARLPAQTHERGLELDSMVNDLQIQQRKSPLPMDDVQHAEEETSKDPLDYQATVNALTLQFLNENEETRVAALQWLSMLHQKAPKKILSMHDGTFPVLLKTLSDPSEEVIKANLQLLAQISSSSEEDYFPLFMANLLSLFSTDRKLLETRGSLIIRQLCLSLNSERIYRTFADLLEKDEDLEFASIMVQNLHLIMITSPELSEFRKRLKNLETRDGQILFTALYRSWSHNAVAAFSLCLLAQAYEHAANLLQIFAELEVTVSLLIQIDKLVQLLESPVFTSLRLQLLEPERHPYLYKCLYGLLMFLPQSSAFLTLRNRLNAVSPLGYLHAAPRSASHSSGTPAATTTGRSTIRRADEIKWQELLNHFRQVQLKHERARRAQPSDSDTPSGATGTLSISGGMRSGNHPGSTTSRRKGTNEMNGVSSASKVFGSKTGQTSRASSATGRPLSPQSQGNPSSSARQPRRVTGVLRR